MTIMTNNYLLVLEDATLLAWAVQNTPQKDHVKYLLGIYENVAEIYQVDLKKGSRTRFIQIWPCDEQLDFYREPQADGGHGYAECPPVPNEVSEQQLEVALKLMEGGNQFSYKYCVEQPVRDAAARIIMRALNPAIAAL